MATARIPPLIEQAMGIGGFKVAVAGPPALSTIAQEDLFAVPPEQMSQFVGAASWDVNDPRQPLATALVRAAESAAQVVQDTRKEALAVHGGLGQIQAGIRSILDLINRLPRGGGNVEAHEQTIRYLMTLLERLRTVVPEEQQRATRTQDYKNLLDELKTAEEKLQEELGQGGRKSTTTGGRRKRRRKRGGFMYSPAARKASVARLKSRKALGRTYRRKRHKDTVRRRRKETRRRQRKRRIRRRRGGRTRSRRGGRTIRRRR